MFESNLSVVAQMGTKGIALWIEHPALPPSRWSRWTNRAKMPFCLTLINNLKNLIVSDLSIGSESEPKTLTKRLELFDYRLKHADRIISPNPTVSTGDCWSHMLCCWSWAPSRNERSYSRDSSKHMRSALINENFEGSVTVRDAVCRNTENLSFIICISTNAHIGALIRIPFRSVPLPYSTLITH